jgi:hypothetical protein
MHGVGLLWFLIESIYPKHAVLDYNYVYVCKSYNFLVEVSFVVPRLNCPLHMIFEH